MWLLLNQGGSQVLSFVGTLYLARILGVASFGVYSLALAIGQYLAIVGDFGTSVYGTRLIAARRKQAAIIFPQMFTMRLMASVGVFFVFWLILYFLQPEQHTYWMIFWGGFLVIANSINSEWFLKGVERMELVTAGNFVISLTFIISILLMVNDNGDATTAIFMRSFAYLPGGLFMVFLIRSKITCSNVFLFKKIPKKMFKESFSYMLTGGISSLYIYSYILILGFFVDNVTLGLFSAAYRLLLVIILFGSVLPMAFFPILADLHQKDMERFKSVHSFFQLVLLAVSLPIASSAWIFAPEIIRSFFSQDFSPAVLIFRWLALALPLVFLRFAFGQSLLACGHHKAHLFANSAGCIVAATVTLFLSKKMGGEGAALAFLIGEAAIFSFMFMSFGKHIFFTFPRFRDCAILVGLSFVMVILMRYTDIHYVFRFILGMGTYSVGVFFSGILTKHLSLIGLQREKAC